MSILIPQNKAIYPLYIIFYFLVLFSVSFLISTWGALSDMNTRGTHVIYHDCINKDTDVDGRPCNKPGSIHTQYIPLGKDLQDRAIVDAIIAGILVIPLGTYCWINCGKRF